jgi:hypothetical protein
MNDAVVFTPAVKFAAHGIESDTEPLEVCRCTVTESAPG